MPLPAEMPVYLFFVQRNATTLVYLFFFFLFFIVLIEPWIFSICRMPVKVMTFFFSLDHPHYVFSRLPTLSQLVRDMSGWVQGQNQKGAWVFRKPPTLRENSIFFYICIAQKSFFTTQWPPHGKFSGSAPGWVGECVQVSYVAEKKSLPFMFCIMLETCFKFLVPIEA